MKQFEYKYVQWMATKPTFNTSPSPVDSIDELGLEGWELVSAFEIGGGQAICHYLKREIQKPKTKTKAN